MKWFVYASGVVFLVGCSGRVEVAPESTSATNPAVDSGATSDAAVTADVGIGTTKKTLDEYCATVADHAVQCGARRSDAEARCKEGGACPMGVLRDEAIPIFFNCVANLPCNQSGNNGGDQCFSQAGAGLPPTSQSTAYVAACNKRASECGRSMNQQSCESAAVLRPELLSAMTSCFQLSCSSVEPCIQKTLFGSVPACANQSGGGSHGTGGGSGNNPGTPYDAGR